MSKRAAIIATGVALVFLTLFEYLPVVHHQFVGIDDHQYVTENPHVAAGVTVGGMVWAFRTGHASNWHPVTWISHMVDCQIYGLAPGGHHLTNVIVHAANSLLLFLLLLRMTGTAWRCAVVAALFAWHPLHVESVAWVSERKDVLSTLFFILTIWAYVNYTRGGAVRRRQYLLALGLFALGLMSKPMLVTLPCLLLLLDYWPLARFSEKSLLALVREKLPFFALAVFDGVVTCLVQRGAATSLDTLPFPARVSNALLAYIRYLANIFWPTRLAVLYPYSKSTAIIAVVGAALLLAALTVLCLTRARRQPYLIVGWLWFLGALVPTIGLIQVGSQSMADRYMYIPSIGLFVALTWGVADAIGGVRYGKAILGGVVAIILAGCLVLTRSQVRTWENSERLFRHAIEVTQDNYIAWDGLGSYFDSINKPLDARQCYAEAVRLKPNYAQAQYDLGTLLLHEGNLDEAITCFGAALRHDPAFAAAHINLGKALLGQKKVAEATSQMAEAVRLTPDDPDAQYNLGTVLLMQSKNDEAADCFVAALKLKPDYADAHRNLGIILAGKGDVGGGIIHFQEASRLDPGNPDAHFNLGVAFLQAKQPADATNQFVQMLRIQPDSAKAHYELAVAFAQLARVAEAAEHARKAGELAHAAGMEELGARSDALLKSLPTGTP